MALTPGTRIGPYEVTAQIGEGGMGEVYRATDTNLKRAVALKVLPASVAADAERLARFQREAEVLASLNHPNIAQIHGLEKDAGTTALVMELVEGSTLADLLGRRAGSFGPAETSGLPLEDALSIAQQIADALEAAHERGLIHRDLKPANVKVRPDGTVKVLDFGLAKLTQVSGSGFQVSELTASPTITSPAAMTGVGIILGTAAYMSPEQARGKVVDRRADIWAFGCVLYEMLTGKRAFVGDDMTVTLARVVEREPDFEVLPAAVPARVRQALRVCLRKDPRQRAADIRDVRLALEGAFETEVGRVLPSESEEARRGRAGNRVAWSVAGVLLVLVGATLAAPYLRAPALAPEMRVEIRTPATSDPVSFAISPDGTRLVYVASGDGASQLWLRALNDVDAQPLAGTAGAQYPFWSPDSRSVAFFADGRLKRFDLGGGQPQVLANAPSGRGGTWSDEGVLLFAPSLNTSLYRIAASGGEAVAVTTIEAGQLGHRFPAFLPGGRHFLFYTGGTQPARGIYLGSLDSPGATRLTDADSPGAYAPPDRVLFIRQGSLVARRLDLSRGELTGDPLPVADSVGLDINARAGAFSVSPSGPIAYRAGAPSRRQLIWFDRSGRTLGTIGASDESGLTVPALSPDGRRVAVHRSEQGNADIWLLDDVRTTRFTFDTGLDRFAIWSPDGSRIVFESNRNGQRDLYEKPSNGAGGETLLLESPQTKVPWDWSPDGRFLLYAVAEQDILDVWALPLEGDRKPFAFLNGRFEELNAQFSPDGRWVAYVSNESGRYESYVRPFPTSAGQWQISTGGGIWPRWSLDGRELYYIAPDGTLMVVPIAVTGTLFEAGAPVALFRTQVYGGGTNPFFGSQYDVASDGRFLFNVATAAADSAITLVLNWTGGVQN